MRSSLLSKSFARGFMVFFSVGAVSSISLAASQNTNGLHSDYRKTSKLELNLDFSDKSARSPLALVEAFLSENQSQYGISKNTEIRFIESKKSLIGTHFYYQQYLNGYKVDNGGISLSVHNNENKIYKVYNNFYPVPSDQNISKTGTVVSKKSAFDASWKDLSVHGRLLEQPTSETVYVVDQSGKFTLVVKTLLHVEAPLGAWEHVIDAKSGKIISRRDTRIERIKHKDSNKVLPYTGKVWNRSEEFSAYEMRAKKIQKANNIPVVRADGTGLVFDPDPRTTLMDATLQDNSPASAFEAAYFEKSLNEISQVGNEYQLKGPWVKITDFESPSVSPSISIDGGWTAKRGDVAFNDVMTYYHLDKNQRYMQSLGFVGETGIQHGAIEVDANGVNGDDNSHFIPSSNRMAFGHGCVDDNEDSDVILHEYGHAINYSINSSWGGGDSGAMGEGFGDYWAGSYSTSVNGLEFQRDRVFNWDGAPCWDGRSLNADNARYDHSKTYGAHSRQGGFVSDELWSTPLYQTLVSLLAQGIERREVDQIILEAQFGLGSGLKMRDMARSVVSAASRLYPDGPHAAEFISKFSHHQILDVAQATINLGDYTVSGVGSDGVIDPGETATLMVNLRNNGTLVARQIIGLLSTDTANVSVVENSSRFPDLEIGANSNNMVPFKVKLADSFECGATFQLDLGLGFDGGPATSAQFPLILSTGRPSDPVAYDVETNQTIPDNTPSGLMDTLTIEETGAVSTRFSINVMIQHPYVGDLEVVLISPRGTEIKLHARSGGSSDDIDGTYPLTLTPAESLSSLIGEPIQGVWKIKASDHAGSDVGKLMSWGISDVLSYQCQ